MFAKLHQQQQQHHNQFQHHPHHHHHHHHQLNLDTHFSDEEEDESRSSGGGARSISKKPKPDPDSEGRGGNIGGEEDTIEVAKRPRGRPPGSKNKPKPPLIITRDTECAMRPLFLELPSGLDVIDAIARFTHRRNIGLTVLTASGSVTTVSFRQSNGGGASGTVVTFHGRFEILSISATFLPPSLPITTSTAASSPSMLPSSFMISLVGPQGQIIGGSVAGTLITAGTVFIVAASFDNPSYHRLTIEDDVAPSSTSAGGGGGEESNQHNNHQDSSNQMVESCGMSMYHVTPPPPPPDLIWTPTPRPPPPF